MESYNMHTTKHAGPDRGDYHHSLSHVKHCFNYLRQALMCAADMTFEVLQVAGDDAMPGVNGWGVEHVCRDWNAVWKWTEERRAT